jgi:polygalacturonase
MTTITKVVELAFRRILVLNFLSALIFFSCYGKADEATPENGAQAKAAVAVADEAWSRLPGILAQIMPPTFPDRTFVITQYGAKGDGVTDCTEAFRKAVDACNQAGGGRVVVPAGVYLTGAIHLKSNVDLDVARGATIRFSTNPKSYLPVVFTRYEGTEVMNYSPFIYALGQKNIAITGEGTLDGQASKGVWYSWKRIPAPKKLVAMGDRGVPVAQRIFGAGHHLRPNFIQPIRCQNVLIAGIHITNSPMWVLNPVFCTNVTVQGVTVDTQGPNTDGCDPDSCTDVLIKDCHFSDGDDCIAIKSGRDVDGRRVNIPSQNIVVQNCVFADGHGGVSVGSETSGGVQNVYAENCQFDSTNLNIAMRFKTGMTRGGFIKNVYIRNCTVKAARTGIGINMRYSGTLQGHATPVVQDINIRHCKFDQLTEEPVIIKGFSDSVRVTDVTIANCVFPDTGVRSIITNASRVYFIDTHGLN